MGWDGYTETRILLWDSVMYWKLFKANVLNKEKENKLFHSSFDQFVVTDNYDAILNIDGNVEEEFAPSGNMRYEKVLFDSFNNC